MVRSGVPIATVFETLRQRTGRHDRRLPAHGASFGTILRGQFSKLDPEMATFHVLADWVSQRTRWLPVARNGNAYLQDQIAARIRPCGRSVEMPAILGRPAGRS